MTADILPLSELSLDATKDWGHNGYVSDKIYEVTYKSSDNGESFVFELKDLAEPYVKHWTMTDEDMEEYTTMIKEEHSFGAYVEGELVGLIICEGREWNNTLFIENILISETYRSKGLGKLLIDRVIEHGAKKEFRQVELEVQNTNVPALMFYKKRGFVLTGLGMREYDDNEIALYMTYDLIKV